MGREVRRVSANWQHPKDEQGNYIPLLDDYYWAARDWLEGEGDQPQTDNYMPYWHNYQRTHYQMYEVTSEGTPISPVMDSPENLARWLVDNQVSAFAGQTATYEQWLKVCQGHQAVSGVIVDGVFKSGLVLLDDD
ncbi:MAG: hypothetical protein V7731_01145 [Amphritea sp.]